MKITLKQEEIPEDLQRFFKKSGGGCRQCYVCHLVSIFDEVKRILHPTGTLWLNLGDSFSGSGPSGASYQSNTTKRRAGGNGIDGNFRVSQQLTQQGLTYTNKKPIPAPGLKAKDLCMIPARVALALQQSGWWLRQTIIWAKGLSFCESYSGSVMPESVTDRPTSSHEYIFLLTKAEQYFYDQEAVREPTGYGATNGYHAQRRLTQAHQEKRPNGANRIHYRNTEQTGFLTGNGGRNLRSVWAINPQSYPGAHFATFGEDLVRPMIQLGTSERGCCPTCLNPWIRVVHKVGERQDRFSTTNALASVVGGTHRERTHTAITSTTGWRPTCRHYPYVDKWLEVPHQQPKESDDAYRDRIMPIVLMQQQLLSAWSHERTIPCTVADIFAGSGTTLFVARDLGRHSIGIELNPDYGRLAMKRLRQQVLPLTLGGANA